MESSDTEGTYLVEHYRPGLGVGHLRHGVTDLRAVLNAQARVDPSIHLLCSLIVPDDEAFLVVIRASSQEHVAEAFDRAGVTFDRISVAIAEIDATLRPNPHL